MNWIEITRMHQNHPPKGSADIATKLRISDFCPLNEIQLQDRIMSEIQKIYKVKIDDTPAELEFTENSMLCTTGDTVHFKVYLDGKSLRDYEFQKPNKIALNIYTDSKLKFVRLTAYAGIITNNTRNTTRYRTNITRQAKML